MYSSLQIEDHKQKVNLKILIQIIQLYTHPIIVLLEAVFTEVILVTTMFSPLVFLQMAFTEVALITLVTRKQGLG